MIPENEIKTPANIVTLIRICFIPVFVVILISPWPAWVPAWPDANVWQPWLALGVFVVLAATDSLDGYLARSRGEVTNLGKFMDPLADKILVAAAMLALIELGILPSWIALIILTREFIISGIRMIAATQGVVIAASWYGKAKTVFQIVALVLFIIKDSPVLAVASINGANVVNIIAWLVMIIALALTIFSLWDYFQKSRELLGFAPQQKVAQRLHAKKPIKDGDKLTEEHVAEVAEQVINAALKQDVLITMAESCTGGMLSSYLTSVPGSSEAFHGGFITYSNEVKHELLGVSTSTLNSVGAVSELCAQEMAYGARTNAHAGLAVSITGIAGPGGAEEGKPVGTVWIGLSSADRTTAQLNHFSGDRNQIRLQATYWALHALLIALTTREGWHEVSVLD